MSSFEFSLWDDSSSEEECDMTEQEDTASILMMHKNKRSKLIRRDRQGAHDRLMHNYSGPNLMCPERYFRRRFRLSLDLFLYIANCVKQHKRSLSRGGI